MSKWISQPIRLKTINLATEQINAFIKMNSSDSLKNADSQIEWVIESFIQTFGSFIHAMCLLETPRWVKLAWNYFGAE